MVKDCLLSNGAFTKLYILKAIEFRWSFFILRVRTNRHQGEEGRDQIFSKRCEHFAQCSRHSDTESPNSNHPLFWIFLYGLVKWLGRQFEYQKFQTTIMAVLFRYSDHIFNTGPFVNWTTIYHSNTKHVPYLNAYKIF